MKSREEILTVYDAVVAAHPEIERKGKTMPYTSANGYMFSLVNKDNEMGIRLPKEEQKIFNEKYNSGPFMSHGAKMKDYVSIPEALHNELKLLTELLDKGHRFVLSLPPK